MTSRRAFPLAVLVTLAGCSAPRIVPQTSPASVPAASVPAARPAPAPERSWEDAAVNAGQWVYARDSVGSIARFIGADGVELASIGCKPATRQIVIDRAGVVPGGALVIRTSYGNLAWSAGARAATNQGLDWMAFSRGRFAIESAGVTRLIVPAWAEVGRVIEDCRG